PVVLELPPGQTGLAAEADGHLVAAGILKGRGWGHGCGTVVMDGSRTSTDTALRQHFKRCRGRGSTGFPAAAGEIGMTTPGLCPMIHQASSPPPGNGGNGWTCDHYRSGERR